MMRHGAEVTECNTRLSDYGRRHGDLRRKNTRVRFTLAPTFPTLYAAEAQTILDALGESSSLLADRLASRIAAWRAGE